MRVNLDWKSKAPEAPQQNHNDPYIPTMEFEKDASPSQMPPENASDSTISSKVGVHTVGPWRKWSILFFICYAQFWDIVNVTAPTIALPTIARNLNMTASQKPWIVSAYALSFAGLLLLSGRLADMLGPKRTFIFGYFVLGISAIIAGVSPNAIMHFVFRAIQGIGAALTIPSGMSLIATHFQGKLFSIAFGIFAAAGCIGNVLGVIIGGVIAAKIDWRWIYYITAICTLPAGIASIFVCVHIAPGKPFSLKGLDVPGVFLATSAVILITFAFSGASSFGWVTATILVPLILGVLLFIVFIYVEHKVKDPVVPPSLFSVEFLVFVGIAFSLYFWFNSLVYQVTMVFEYVFEWSPLSTAVHFIPLGMTGLVASFSSGFLIKFVPVRYIMPVCQALMVGGALLLSFVRQSHDYARLVIPGFLIGNAGMACCFAPVNISLMELCPRGMEGVVGAVFNSAVQVGSGVGIAILALASDSIANSHEQNGMDSTKAQAIGLGQSFYILVAFCGLLVMMLLVTVVFRTPRSKDVDTNETSLQELEPEFELS